MEPPDEDLDQAFPGLSSVETIRLLLRADGTYRAYLLRTLPPYWRAVDLARRFAFGLRRLVFSASQRASAGREASLFTWSLSRVALWPAIRAAALLQLIALSERGLIATWPRLLLPAQALVPERDGLLYVLSTVAQVAGVFLGLYFTALSVVASTVYKDVPGDVRTVVLQEKAGHFYIQVVATLCAMSLMQLGAVTLHLGWSHGLFNLLAIEALSLVAVFSFAVLGVRAFTFFDPAAIAGHLDEKIGHALRGVQAKAPHSSDRSFQRVHQQRTERALQTYEALVHVSDSRSLAAGDSLSSLIASLVRISRAYIATKPNIPADSYWFRNRRRHDSWLLANSVKQQLMAAVAGELQPSDEPDRSWFERETRRIIVAAMRALLERGDLARIVEAAGALYPVIDELAARFEIEDAVAFCDDLSRLGAEAATVAARTETDERVRWAAVRSLLYGIVMLLVALTREAAQSVPAIRAAASALVRDLTVPVGFPMPKDMRDALQRLSAQLKHEQRAEGAVVTPQWYVEYALAAALARFLTSAITPITGRLRPTYVDLAKILCEEEKWDEAAGVVFVGLETCRRVAINAESLERIRLALKDFERPIGDLPFPEFTTADSVEMARGVRWDLEVLLAEISQHLRADKPTGEHPDQFGRSYVTIGDACLEALLAEDKPRFAQLYAPFFQLSIRAFSRLIAEVATYDRRQIDALVSDPIIDLLDMSGYAIALSKLLDIDVADDVGPQWQRYLSQQARAKLELFVAANATRHATFLITPRSERRGTWHREVFALLSRRGWVQDRYGPYDRATQIAIDPFAREFLRHSMMDDAAEFFFAMHLADTLRAMGVAIPRGARGILASVERDRVEVEVDDEP